MGDYCDIFFRSRTRVNLPQWRKRKDAKAIRSAIDAACKTAAAKYFNREGQEAMTTARREVLAGGGQVTMSTDIKVGTIYQQVTVCEADVKTALEKAGYAPTTKNADKVGYSSSVQKQWLENDVSAWLTVIECGIDEVKDELAKA